MAASLFNFLYYPVMARMVPANIYGEIQFLVALLFQVSTIFMALNVITIILSVKYCHSSDLLKNKITMLSTLFNIITFISTISLIVILFLGGNSLHFNSPISFIMLGVAAVSTVPFTIGIGKLQGQGKYIEAGVMNMVGSFIKFAASILFVILGLKTPGAILGIAVGQLSAVAIAIILGKLVFSELFSLNISNINMLKIDKKLILSTGICVLIVNLLSVVDTIVAKTVLSPRDAGIYAGIATLAKIALYVVSPLMWMIIPAAATLDKQHSQVKKIFIVALALCLMLTIGYITFTDLTINFIIGEKFIEMENLLVYATIAMSLLALSSMSNIILAARGKYKNLIIQTVIMTTPVIITLLFIDNLNVYLILTAQLISGALGMIYYYIVYLFKRKQS